MANCIFCHFECTIRDNDEILHIDCPNCGQYRIIRDANDDLPYEFERRFAGTKHLVAGYLREINDSGLKPEVITSDDIERIFLSSLIPRNLVEKLDKLLLSLNRQTQYFGHELHIMSTTLAIAYAENTEELKSLLYALSDMQYIDLNQMGNLHYNVIMKIGGLQHAIELSRKAVASNQCFVAMWFTEEMLEVYDKYIAVAIIDAGYKPLIISDKEHNDDICDHIIAEIRNSKFVVADFTGQRGGVYYEAGFAYGLGLPVIWTCKKDWFNELVEEEIDVMIGGQPQRGTTTVNRKTHFDIEHNNFIIWENGDDSAEKLVNRIKATVPK